MIIEWSCRCNREAIVSRSSCSTNGCKIDRVDFSPSASLSCPCSPWSKISEIFQDVQEREHCALHVACQVQIVPFDFGIIRLLWWIVTIAALLDLTSQSDPSIDHQTAMAGHNGYLNKITPPLMNILSAYLCQYRWVELSNGRTGALCNAVVLLPVFIACIQAESHNLGVHTLAILIGVTGVLKSPPVNIQQEQADVKQVFVIRPWHRDCI